MTSVFYLYDIISINQKSLFFLPITARIHEASIRTERSIAETTVPPVATVPLLLLLTGVLLLEGVSEVELAPFCDDVGTVLPGSLGVITSPGVAGLSSVSVPE